LITLSNISTAGKHWKNQSKREDGGIQNPLFFRKSLAANTLLRILNNLGIWHTVILDKYLCHYTVKSWLLAETVTPRSASLFWKNLLKSKHLISSWLYWHPGSSHTIVLGRDNILGMDASTTLTPNLITHLHSQNITYLYQIHDISRPGAQPDSCISSESLSLTADATSDWNGYCDAHSPWHTSHLNRRSYSLVGGRPLKNTHNTKCICRNYKHALAHKSQRLEKPIMVLVHSAQSKVFLPGYRLNIN
jgi:hypothetical protein